MRNQYNIKDRKGLKEYFKKGKLPDENAFIQLIDSTFNIADDKLDINDDGLQIYPSENEKGKLLSFYADRDAQVAKWALITSKKPNQGLSINKINEETEGDDSQKETTDAPALFIQEEGGKIGMGTNFPRQQLDVKGIIASEGRMGTLIENKVKADGNWYNIFDEIKGISGCNAYEIVAYAEGKNKEKFSLMHATALSTWGNSKPKISKTIAHYGKWWNKIDLRWQSRTNPNDEKFITMRYHFFGLAKLWYFITGKLMPRKFDKYNLQIRTRSHYGPETYLHFRVTVLWNSDFITKGDSAK